MAQVDVVHPNAWGVAIPFVATNPGGDLIPWDGDDLHLEFRNTHSSAVTVIVKPVIEREDAEDVGPFFVPIRQFTVAAGVDASFFFDKEFSSAYVNEIRMIQIIYVDGHANLLIRPVTIATTVSGVQDESPQSVSPAFFIAPTAVYDIKATFSQGIISQFIAATGGIFNPSVDYQRIARPNMIGPTSAIFTPAVDFQRIVRPTFLPATGVVFQPTMNQTVPVNFITSTTQFYGPTLTIGGITTLVDAVPSQTIVFQPNVIGPKSVFPEYMLPSGVIFPPVVATNWTVAPDFIGAATSVPNPVWSPGNVTILASFISPAK